MLKDFVPALLHYRKEILKFARRDLQLQLLASHGPGVPVINDKPIAFFKLCIGPNVTELFRIIDRKVELQEIFNLLR